MFATYFDSISRPLLRTYVVKHPDAAGLFGHGHHKFVLGEGKPDGRYPPWNHQPRAFKFRHLKRLPNSLSRGWVEVNPPGVEETTSLGNKIYRLLIR